MTVLAQSSDLTTGERLWLRIGLMINHASMFLGATIVFAYYCHKDTFYRYIRADVPVDPKRLLTWGGAILFSYPLVAFLTEINSVLPLPDWAIIGQDNTFIMLSNVLRMDGISDLIISLILVGVLPAVGEELIFRGIVQNKLAEGLANPHMAIVISSILFGLTHMQLERILPLSFLGVLLGYSYYYSRSIFVPIILHFLNNSLQVISLYSIGEIDPSMLENTPDIPTTLIIGSALAVGTLFLWGQKQSGTHQELHDADENYI
jgi:membrane protease YdiL (CAAX protease family)